MTPSSDTNFEQKGNEVEAEAGALGAATDELKSETESCAEEPEIVGTWVTAIGRALLAIFGASVGGGGSDDVSGGKSQ